MKKIGLVFVGLILLASISLYLNRDTLIRQFFKPRVSLTSTQQPSSPQAISQSEPGVEIIAENLDIPWEIVFLPDGGLLVTERPGRLLHISNDNQTPIEVSGVQHVGEGGLMGLALHPDYQTNKYLYLYLTTRTDGGLTNRLERYTFDENTNQIADRTVILENIPGAANHDGGRIAFGPDKKLYVTTGDAQDEQLAQDTNSLAGKILRINDDGSIPTDNPFDNAVYSYGHRNPQGIAWDERGQLWSTEHGPSGLQTGHDKVNLIEKGANYGWPTIKGDQQREGMKTPVLHSGDDDTWAPAGMTIVDNTIYFTGLRAQTLYSTSIKNRSLEGLNTHLVEQYGRLRVVVFSPDGKLYIATSNTDGRGSELANDDKIIKMDPTVIQ